MPSGAALIQARSIRIRLRGYPDRVPEKAEDHQAAARVRGGRAALHPEAMVDLQAIAAVPVQVEGVHPVEVALLAAAAVLLAVALPVAVQDQAAVQVRVPAAAVEVPDREAVVVIENNLNLRKNLSTNNTE